MVNLDLTSKSLINYFGVFPFLFVGLVVSEKCADINIGSHVVPHLGRTADWKNLGHKSVWGLCPIYISFDSICPVLT